MGSRAGRPRSKEPRPHSDSANASCIGVSRRFERLGPMIWSMIVDEPCPMSCAPLRNRIRPSRDRVTRIAEGFDIEVLPQPYHMQATPAPRRRWRAAAEALTASASARSAVQCGRSASRQATSPTLASST